MLYRSRAPFWPWLHRVAVLVGCLLAVSGPFNESTLLDMLEGRPALPADTTWQETDADSDEDHHLHRTARQVGARNDSRRALQSLLPPSASVCRFALLFNDIRPCSCRPGGEHAFRNGLGTPLLC